MQLQQYVGPIAVVTVVARCYLITREERKIIDTYYMFVCNSVYALSITSLCALIRCKEIGHTILQHYLL